MITPYDPQAVERDAQQYWQDNDSFKAPDNPGSDAFYCLSMFPYPSGRLHMGHVRTYTLGDVIARYQRLKGHSVLHPMGWDAFGLPAENAAIKNNIPPANWTYSNIDYMRGQMQSLGFGFDWSREFATCDPDYYRWEQWFFLRLYEKGLVERRSAIVNWDPVDQTVLANEQVENGRGWRSGAVVERREMQQWFLKITDYADELLDQLDEMPGWPDSVKNMQRNWIGRSHGLEIDFAVAGRDESITVYTTRPDTLLGATYVAVAAQHPLALAAAEHNPELGAFIERCANVKTAEADLATLPKEGMALGVEVEHPLTGRRLPVWTANFVLMDYGSGAVMSVPAHDQRDWEFAREYGLPIEQVIAPADDAPIDLDAEAFVARGITVNSPGFDGLEFQAAFDVIADALEAGGRGRRRTNYRLRDWGVSRQRYWGCPIPMIHCDHCGVVPVPTSDLPVVLPTEVSFEGVRSPLHDMPEWLQVPCPVCGRMARRETDTFDTFMESSWYANKFTSPGANAMLDDRVNLWAPVNHYVGGIEHAILHLLYARFYHKLLRDEGLVASDEPFERLLMLGMVLRNGRKMSKKDGDAGDPQMLIDRYGADAVRQAMMFAAPPEQSVEWAEGGLESASRFLRRIWRGVEDHLAAGEVPALDVAALSDAGLELRRKTHETIGRADDDYGRRVQFNTVVAAGMELANTIAKTPDEGADRAAVREAWNALALVLSPITPHVCHALWQALGHSEPMVDAAWPAVDDAALERSTIELVVQVNGKLRARIDMAADADETAAREAALADENVQRFVADKSLRKAIYVPGKLVNLVVG
ncbi:MAG: leucine--tRNA ligase [Pseudomonadota bacterium]